MNNCKKHKKNTFFLANCSNYISESLTLLFLKEIESNLLLGFFLQERPEQIAHGRSFVKSIVSDLFMVTLF